MARTRTTLVLDEDVLRALKAFSRRTGVTQDDVTEEALRRELGLELVDRRRKRDSLGEEDAIALAVEAQHETRRDRS